MLDLNNVGCRKAKTYMQMDRTVDSRRCRNPTVSVNPLVPCVPKNGTGTPRGITFCVAVRRYKFVSQLVQNSQNHKLGYERA